MPSIRLTSTITTAEVIQCAFSEKRLELMYAEHHPVLQCCASINTTFVSRW